MHVSDKAGQRQQKRYVTEKELSVYLSIPVRTLQMYRLRQIGMPWLKLPTGKVLYDLLAVDAWIAACQAGGGRAAAEAARPGDR